MVLLAAAAAVETPGPVSLEVLQLSCPSPSDDEEGKEAMLLAIEGIVEVSGVVSFEVLELASSPGALLVGT